LKILNVIDNIDEMTGAGSAERTRQLGCHLSDLGHDVTLLTTKYNLTPSNVASLGQVKLIAISCLSYRFYIPLPLFWIFNKAVKEVDVVHLVGHWSLLNAIVYLFVRLHKKPYVISPLGALPIFGRSTLLKRLYNFIAGISIIRKANICVVATLDELPALSSYGVDESAVEHIPNGINENDYLDSGISEEFSFLHKHPFILYIGRLNPIKGPDLLIEAFCRVKDSFPDIHLVYIGRETFEEGVLNSLKKTASEYSILERTHFLGWVSRDDKAAILHASLFLVIPSRQDAMSIVVLESGIVGKPVLITDQCGFDEVADVGGGKVVPATSDGIALGIKELLNHESDLSSMGLNLKKLVQNNFLWSSTAKKYSSIFAQAIKNNM